MESERFTPHTEARYYILFSAKKKIQSTFSCEVFKIHFNIFSSTLLFQVFSSHQFSIRFFYAVLTSTTLDAFSHPSVLF